MLDWLKKDAVGYTQLHAAGKSGYDKVPKELLTAANLTIKDDFKCTSIHYAADCGHLNELPQHILTAEAITMKNSGGWTAIHNAARSGHLDQIPEALLTVENMMLEELAGRTPFFLSAISGHIDQVPLGLDFPESVMNGVRECNWSGINPTKAISRANVAEEWWTRNQEILSEKMQLDEGLAEAPEIELF